MIKSELTEKIIGCAFEVINTLGAGFLEKVYENAMMKEFKLKGISAEQQKPIKVFYKGEVVGDYIADILVENEVIIELKVVKNFNEIHLAQCINYLKSTGKKICLLINFGKNKLEFKRIVF
ncbi:MAG: GxxExxY protein [Fusobacteria bacterium]|nr:GxxExxY protein [Fusobacteriota bacterium]